MSFVRSNERQYPLTAVLDLGPADFGAADRGQISLPPNALLTGITAVTVTAFNSATTAVLDIGDAAGATSLATNIDIRTAGAETVPLQGKFYPSGDTLLFTLSQTGAAATAGRLLVTATYVILNRVSEVQG